MEPDGTCAFTFPLYFRLRFLGFHMCEMQREGQMQKMMLLPVCFRQQLSLRLHLRYSSV